MIESYSSPQKKLTPHMFRHTFCKWMLKATHNDIEKVRRLAGHSNISTTAQKVVRNFKKSKISIIAAAAEIEAQLNKRILPYLKPTPIDEYFNN